MNCPNCQPILAERAAPPPAGDLVTVSIWEDDFQDKLSPWQRAYVRKQSAAKWVDGDRFYFEVPTAVARELKFMPFFSVL